MPKIKRINPKVDGKQRPSWGGIKFNKKFKEDFEGLEVKTYYRNVNTLEKFDKEDDNVEDDRMYTNKEKILSLYPEKEPKPYFEKETEAQKKMGISPEEFYEIHEELRKNGMIFEPRSGFFKRA